MSQQINLYNPLLLKKQKLFSLQTMAEALGLIALVAVLVYGYAWYSASSMKNRAEEALRLHASALTQLETLKAKTGGRQPSKLLQEEVARLESEVNSRRRVVGVLERGELGNKQGFSEYFRALSRQTVNGLWLTGFEVTGSGEMSISGRALKPELVPIFISQLNRETAMAGKNFSALEMRMPPAPPPAETKQTLPSYIEFSLHNTEAGVGR